VRGWAATPGGGSDSGAPRPYAVPPVQKWFQRPAPCIRGVALTVSAPNFNPCRRLPPKRRASDRTPVKLIGWIACLALAGSLTYTFIRALTEGTDQIDPLFFGLQTVASLLFLIYSVKLRNGVFIAANSVALVNAMGTLVLTLAAH
jgi:lipid-A-disaccharide synthase-like uncharacterized protein